MQLDSANRNFTALVISSLPTASSEPEIPAHV